MKKRFLVSAVFCASINCQASDYFFKPVFNSYERYETNIFLIPKPSQDNWITTLSPGLNFGLHRENTQLNSNFTWNKLFYTNQSKLDIDEQLVNVDFQNQTDRFTWGGQSSYKNQASINQVGTINGLALTQVMSKRISIAPTVSYSLDQRSTLSLDYSYEKVTYEKNENNYLANYDYHQASGTYSYLYTEHDKLNMSLSSSRYKTPLQNQTSFNHVAQLGWQHSFSEKLVAYVSGGINYSQVETTVPQLIPGLYLGIFPAFFDPETLSPFDPTTGFLIRQQRFKKIERNGIGKVFRASLQKSFERGNVSFIALQNQTPTSQGLQTQTQLSISGAYTINERWTSGLTAGFTRYEQTGQQNSFLNRTYYSISPNINWKWTPEISLGLTYIYREQDFKSGSQASGNSVQLQFTYQPQTNYQVK